MLWEGIPGDGAHDVVIPAEGFRCRGAWEHGPWRVAEGAAAFLAMEGAEEVEVVVLVDPFDERASGCRVEVFSSAAKGLALLDLVDDGGQVVVADVSWDDQIVEGVTAQRVVPVAAGPFFWAAWPEGLAEGGPFVARLRKRDSLADEGVLERDPAGVKGGGFGCLDILLRA